MNKAADIIRSRPSPKVKNTRVDHMQMPLLSKTQLEIAAINNAFISRKLQRPHSPDTHRHSSTMSNVTGIDCPARGGSIQTKRVINYSNKRLTAIHYSTCIMKQLDLQHVFKLHRFQQRNWNRSWRILAAPRPGATWRTKDEHLSADLSDFSSSHCSSFFGSCWDLAASGWKVIEICALYSQEEHLTVSDSGWCFHHCSGCTETSQHWAGEHNGASRGRYSASPGSPVSVWHCPDLPLTHQQSITSFTNIPDSSSWQQCTWKCNLMKFFQAGLETVRSPHTKMKQHNICILSCSDPTWNNTTESFIILSKLLRKPRVPEAFMHFYQQKNWPWLFNPSELPSELISLKNLS